MKKYVFMRILRSLVSIFLVTTLIYTIIYTMVPRKLIFKQDTNYNKIATTPDNAVPAGPAWGSGMYALPARASRSDRLRRDRRAQVGGLDSLHTVKLLSFAKSILPHFFAFFQRQFSTKTPRRMHGQNAYTKQKEEHRSAPRCELLQFSPASCRRL